MSGGVFYANRARRFFCILRFGCELLSLWCNKKTKTMITVTQSIPATCFSANIPDVEFSIGGYRAAVVMTVDGEEIYNGVRYSSANSTVCWGLTPARALRLRSA